MNNPPPPEPSNPASLPPPPLTQSHAVSPCNTLGLGLHLVPAQGMAPVLTPLPDPTPNPAQVPDSIPSSVPAASTITRLPERLLFKNRLQEYTRRSSLQLPVYRTFNEGSSHAPRFRSTVWVNGAQYTSPNTFFPRKEVEQEVAKLALESILKRVKDEGCPLLHEVHLAKPTYNIVQSPGLLPVFVSTLVFNGVSYTGDTGRNKKEAEQLAARTVILSLPGDSGSLKILYEIIKSKRKLYAALDRVKDPSHSQPNIVHGGVKFGCSETTVSQEQEVRAAIVRDAVPERAISPAASGMRPPHHEFKRSRPDPAPERAPFPIFQLHSHNLFQNRVIDAGSSSAKKKRKNKKKASEHEQVDT